MDVKTVFDVKGDHVRFVSAALKTANKVKRPPPPLRKYVNLVDIVPFSIKFAQLKRCRYLMEGELLAATMTKLALR
jgi:hypothetical protein